MIAGYTARTFNPVGPDPQVQYREVTYLSGSHYGVGPQPLVYAVAFACPFCGGLLGEFSARWFGQHWACVLRARRLAARWAWVGEE